MFTLGVQYYRPPFPNSRFWHDDFARMRDSGLNAVQLWVLWSWVEAAPGRFQFDDYDRLVALAEKNSLGVVLSAIPELQPLWIHREIPGSEMIDRLGRTVISTNRTECHQGITPGACTDHPAVWPRMARFYREVVTRYHSSSALVGWDVWNELRWNVHADGLVCFCPSTIKAFHEWLSLKHGGLDGLNRDWTRRYSAWDEVAPGRIWDKPYTELMAFSHFLTCRVNAHARIRYDLVKSLDPAHPVTVHGAFPCVTMGGDRLDHPLNRGNDWSFAEHLDGIGCSSFPKWGNMDDADFAARVEFVKSAARSKRVWLSEVQGGRAATGFNVYAHVDAPSQQRWIWNGLACGAETILFWCWRDEVFGHESGGFGLAGADGHADERIEAMRVTGARLREHASLLERYRPVQPQVGIFFSPQTYYMHWSYEGNADRAQNALLGYARALARKSIPYLVVEEEHLDALKGLKVLFMPRTLVVDDSTASALESFVRKGGALLTESECGAFGSNGLWRYPADRFTARLSGLSEVGRRPLSSKTVTVKMSRRSFKLGACQWFTPCPASRGRSLASVKDGSLLLDLPLDKGRLLLGGAYFGQAYRDKFSHGFEDFVERIVLDAGVTPPVEVVSPKPTSDSFVFLKYGLSGRRRVLFAFLPQRARECRLRFAPDFFKTGKARDIISDKPVTLKKTKTGLDCLLKPSAWNLSVLVED